jgi:glycosyltransferase involved in cell wall biosynthesis
VRILAITDYHRERVENGSEVFCSRLIHSLRRSHDVYVVARASEGSRADWNVDDAAFEDLKDIAQLLPWHIDPRAYDCVYNLGGLIFGCRMVEVLRALYGDLPVVNHFQTLLGPLARVEGYCPEDAMRQGEGQRKAAAGALLNIVLSRDELGFAVNELRVAPHTAVVIPNGLPFEEFNDVTPDRSYIRHDAGRRFVIAAGGRFSDASKGADLLYRAFVQFHAEAPEAFLVVAANSERFLPILGDLPAGSWSRQPWLGRPRFQQMLAGADLVVVPSRYEPFGLIAIEAMSAGVPVLANAVGGLAEIVVPGESGALNPLQDGSYGLLAAMRSLYSDRSALKRMGAAAREYVRKRYDIARIAAEIGMLLEQVTRRAAV